VCSWTGSAERASCDELVGLTRRQIGLLCRRYPDLVDAVWHASVAVINECQHQLRNERWNCPLVDDTAADVLNHLANAGRFVS